MSQHTPTIDATVPDVMDIINIQIIFTVVHDHVFYRLGTVVKSITCVLYRNIIFLFRPFGLLFPNIFNDLAFQSSDFESTSVPVS